MLVLHNSLRSEIRKRHELCSMKDCEYVNIVHLNRGLINEEEKSRKWIEKYSFYFSYLFHVEKNQREKKEEIVWF